MSYTTVLGGGWWLKKTLNATRFSQLYELTRRPLIGTLRYIEHRIFFFKDRIYIPALMNTLRCTSLKQKWPHASTPRGRLTRTVGGASSPLSPPEVATVSTFVWTADIACRMRFICRSVSSRRRFKSVNSFSPDGQMRDAIFFLICQMPLELGRYQRLYDTRIVFDTRYPMLALPVYFVMSADDTMILLKFDTDTVWCLNTYKMSHRYRYNLTRL